MLASRAGRGFLHQLSTSSSINRVDKLAPVLISLSSAYSTVTPFELVLRPQCPFSIRSQDCRGLATRQASKPKAHTGRTTSTRSRKPKSTTAESETAAKPKPKPKSKPVKTKRRVKTKSTTKNRTRVKKRKTAEEKAEAAIKAQKKTIRELKRAAVKPPTRLPVTAWTVLSAEMSKANKGLNSKAASVKYHSLIPEELEHYNHLANQNKAKNQAAYDAWVKSLTPTAVDAANKARLRLRRLGVKIRRPRIADDRIPKKPVLARNFFLKDRYASGDLRGMNSTDAFRIITREWKELSVAEKQPYIDLHARSREQYVQDVKRVFDRDVGPPRTTAAAAAA